MANPVETPATTRLRKFIFYGACDYANNVENIEKVLTDGADPNALCCNTTIFIWFVLSYPNTISAEEHKQIFKLMLAYGGDIDRKHSVSKMSIRDMINNTKIYMNLGYDKLLLPIAHASTTTLV